MRLRWQNYRLNWKRDLFDHRDRVFKVPARRVRLPRNCLNRDLVARICDQEEEGSCTANAGANGHDAARIANGLAPIFGARDFLYANTLILERNFGRDDGAQIRNTFKALAQYGICSEENWPYTGLGYRTRPTRAAYAEAADNQLDEYQQVPQDTYSLQYALAKRQTIEIGFEVYESFMSAKVARTGLMPMPNPRREAYLGGHAVLLIGYGPGYFVAVNSWGEDWGQGGMFQMPAAVLLDRRLASDFWTPIHTEPGPATRRRRRSA